MRLLKVTIHGANLFRNDCLALDLYASDRVPKADDGLPTADVYHVGEAGSIYSQNVVGIAGVNASGKTTVLNLLHFVLDILAGEVTMRAFRGQDLTMGKVGTSLKMEATFWHDNAFYLLESALERDERRLFAGPSSMFGFRFVDETLWRLGTARVNRKMISDSASFKAVAEIVCQRHGNHDGTTLTESELRLLGDDRSIVTIVTGRMVPRTASLYRGLPVQTLASPVVQAFDSSVERLEWDPENEVYVLQFKGEPVRVVDRNVASMLLSRGTVYGAEMVHCATGVLSQGGFLLVDEMEEAINRSLVSTVIELFASPITNPHGAQLVFTTHYPELLDVLHRKDNVYLLVRGEDQITDVIKYSIRVHRIENKKSEVVLSDLIKGTMPRYPDVQAMRDYVRRYVNEGA
ncbi:MAG: ATP-binding protein [Atopobiaceae bacterium]|nr:ATP-binding protein [Atopobiaceae bacterium]